MNYEQCMRIKSDDFLNNNNFFAVILLFSVYGLWGLVRIYKVRYKTPLSYMYTCLGHKIIFIIYNDRTTSYCISILNILITNARSI